MLHFSLVCVCLCACVRACMAILNVNMFQSKYLVVRFIPTQHHQTCAGPCFFWLRVNIVQSYRWSALLARRPRHRLHKHTSAQGRNWKTQLRAPAAGQQHQHNKNNNNTTRSQESGFGRTRTKYIHRKTFCINVVFCGGAQRTLRLWLISQRRNDLSLAVQNPPTPKR